MRRREGAGGFTILELAVTIGVIGVLGLFAGTIITNAVQTATGAMQDTEASMRARRALDEVESLLAPASRGSLESIVHASWMGTTQDFRASMDDKMGLTTLGDFALPLGNQAGSLVFFRTATVQPDGSAGVEPPPPAYFAIYTRPMQVDGHYELVYFDGQSRRILCKDLTDVKFTHQDGLVDAELFQIVDSTTTKTASAASQDRLGKLHKKKVPAGDGQITELEVKSVKRLIVVRSP